MVREERLELSHPRILEPKSSASTNSATPASYFLSQHSFKKKPRCAHQVRRIMLMEEPTVNSFLVVFSDFFIV